MPFDILAVACGHHVECNIKKNRVSKHPKNLFHCAFTVSLKQHFQSFNIFQNLFAGVGVAYHQPFPLRFDQFRSGFDVFIFGQCGIDALEWLGGI